MYYGGGAGGGYLIGESAQNLAGSKGGSYNQGAKGFLGDLMGSVTGRGPSMAGNIGGLAGGLAGGAMGSGGGSGIGGMSMGSGGNWGGWNFGGGNMGGLSNLFGGGGGPTSGSATIGMPADQNYGVDPIQIGQQPVGTGTVLAPGYTPPANAGSGGGMDLSKILDITGSGQGGGLGGTLKNAQALQGLLGGGGQGGGMQAPPPIQRTPQSQVEPITPATATVTPTPQLAPTGATASPMMMAVLQALMGKGLGA